MGLMSIPADQPVIAVRERIVIAHNPGSTGDYTGLSALWYLSLVLRGN
jgi:hypothetical protein